MPGVPLFHHKVQQYEWHHVSADAHCGGAPRWTTRVVEPDAGLWLQPEHAARQPVGLDGHQGEQEVFDEVTLFAQI